MTGDEVATYTVEPAPDGASVAHNEQMVARARDDLGWHVVSAGKVLDQGADDTDAVTVVASALILAGEDMPRERLAALLAVALVRLAHHREGARP